MSAAAGRSDWVFPHCGCVVCICGALPSAPPLLEPGSSFPESPCDSPPPAWVGCSGPLSSRSLWFPIHPPYQMPFFTGREGLFSEGKGKASTASSPRSCLTPSDRGSVLPFASLSSRLINVGEPLILGICAVQYGSH